MMDKDFVKLNEEELKDVAGGKNLTWNESIEFEALNTAKEASDYLLKSGIVPTSAAYRTWMAKWEEKHS